MIKVGIVIVSWQAERYLPDLIRSLFKCWPSEIETRIFWVENASTDGTRSWIEKWQGEHPTEDQKIKWVMSETNTGFCGGNNIGIKKAIAWGAEYVYLLNQDTEVTAGWLEESAYVAETDPMIASVQSLLLLHPEVAPDGRCDVVNSWGNQIHYLGFCYCGRLGQRWSALGGVTPRSTPSAGRAVGDIYPRPAASLPRPSFQSGLRQPPKEQHPLEPQPLLPNEITYGMGAGVLYRVGVLHTIGLFDEEAFAYHDDNDLGLRFRLVGYKNVLAQKSVVYHKYNSKLSANKFFWNERARYLLVLKFYSTRTLFVFTPAFLVFEIALWGWAILHGYTRPKARATWWLVTHLRWIWQRRRAVQRLRRVDDRKLTQFLTGQFDVAELNSPLVRIVGNFFEWYWLTVKWVI